MEQREGVCNISFFKKVWYSITKFEQYPAMATEGFKRAIIYLIIMSLFVTIFMSISNVIEMHKIVGNLADYVEENIPDFTYDNGVVTMETEEPIIIDDIQYEGIDRIVVEPSIDNDEEKAVFEQENDVEGVTVFFFKEQIILRIRTENGQTNTQPYTYEEFISGYTPNTVEKFNKAELIEYITGPQMSYFYLNYGLTVALSYLVINILVMMCDALEIAIFGWLTAIIARIRIRFVAIYNMAIYSLTLPIILNIIYIIINYFTNFVISYFQVAYITIAYIYLAATIFILKDDIIKRMQEVEKIKDEQKNVRREIEKQEKEEQKKQTEDKKENKEPKDGEPPEEKKEEKDGNEKKQGEEPDGAQA